MKYALLIYLDPNAPDDLTPAEREAVTAEYFAIRDLPGVYDGAHLHPPTTATTVRVQNGEALTTDGPFADTKEIFGGYFLMEADDIEAPLAVAARIPAARNGGSVEIRPIFET